MRFAFGGAITVVTGLVGQHWGPTVGGLILAFPAILPATVTLVNKHAGRAQARDDTRGAAAGSVGLLAAALVVWRLAGDTPTVLVLVGASAAWLAVSFAVWRATVA